MTEDTPPGSDFLAELGVAWEREAMSAATATRVVLLRTGVVLAREGGALRQMALPFRFFAGGPIGSGRQGVSWIHIDDWVSDGSLGHRDAACGGTAQPHRSGAGEQCRVRAHARPRARASGHPARSGVCGTARAWRDEPPSCSPASACFRSRRSRSVSPSAFPTSSRHCAQFIARIPNTRELRI